MTERTILVFGATGTQGRPVADAMLERGFTVRAATRDPSAAAETLPGSMQTVTADLADRESLRAAMVGADAVFFHMPLLPDAADAGAGLDNVLRAAARTGVRRLIYSTSGFCHDALPDGPFVGALRAAARRVLAADTEAVVLRPTLYLANLLWPYLISQLRDSGRLTYPPLSHERRLSWTAPEDQGRIAAACVDADVAGRTVDVASPEPVTGPELCRLLAAVFGREVHYAPQTRMEFADTLGKLMGSRAAGQAIAGMYAALDSLPPDGAIVDTRALERRFNVRLTPVSRWVESSIGRLVALYG